MTARSAVPSLAKDARSSCRRSHALIPFARIDVARIVAIDARRRVHVVTALCERARAIVSACVLGDVSVREHAVIYVREIHHIALQLG